MNNLATVNDVANANDYPIIDKLIDKMIGTLDNSYSIMHRIKNISHRLEVEVAQPSKEDSKCEYEPMTIPERLRDLIKKINDANNHIKADITTIEKYI